MQGLWIQSSLFRIIAHTNFSRCCRVYGLAFSSRAPLKHGSFLKAKGTWWDTMKPILEGWKSNCGTTPYQSDAQNSEHEKHDLCDNCFIPFANVRVCSTARRHTLRENTWGLNTMCTMTKKNLHYSKLTFFSITHWYWGFKFFFFCVCEDD